MNRRGYENAAVRRALIEAAARLIATEGVGALTLRRVAEEVGTSTMAIYTHFGGMPELRRAVRREGYARLAAAGGAVEETDDTHYDADRLVRVYNELPVGEPHLYKIKFIEQS